MPEVITELETQIRAAFNEASPPADNELLHPDCRDDVDVLEFYGGVRWQDMTGKNVIYSYAAPTGFSALAFRYYLPAFLLWTLKNPDGLEYASESILISLDPGTERELLHEFRKSKFALFNAQQIAATRAFLWHLEKHPYLGHFAQSALVNDWIDA